MKRIVVVFMGSILFQFTCLQAQTLLPGFDAGEYRELMLVSARTPHSETYASDLPEPGRFKRVYRSPILGLDNYWDFWLSNNQQAAISIRGTTAKPESWLANFYAAMVPATGTLALSSTDSFHYQLASNPKAAVHVGWLTCMAYLSRDILPKIKEQYQDGVKNFYIIGHSQGGAISFLLTAYLYNLQKQGQLPADIRFKTYCSAGPKPGNLYFAYEYEAMTQNGWAYNVVNAADWVPQTPISVQTLNDFAATNPFVHAKPTIQQQKFPINLLLKYVYNQLNNSTDKAMRKYQKYLGRLLSGMVKKYLKEYREPAYFNSIDYVRAGNQVVLLPDDAYFKLFPDNEKNVFIHHFHKPYLYLLEQLKTPTALLPYNSVAYTPTQAEIAAAVKQTQPNPAKKLFLHGMMGLQFPALANLNELYRLNQRIAAPKIAFARGGGFYTVFPQAKLATLFQFSTYAASRQADQQEHQIRGAMAGTSLGYVWSPSKKWHWIPFAGLQYSWFSSRVTPTIPASLNVPDVFFNGIGAGQEIKTRGWMLNLGMQVSVLPFRQGEIGKHIFIGLRPGYAFPLGSTRWWMGSQRLSGGPSVNSQGWYVQGSLGVAL